jgi:PPM family protein phosphatase
MKPNSIAIDIAACSDVGLVRKNNEDFYLASDLNTGQSLGDLYEDEQALGGLYLLLAVSDGMGGHKSGEVASRLAVTVLRDRLIKLPRRIRPYDRLVQAVEEANYQVYRKSRSNAEHFGMGATLTAALIEGNKVYIAEVGDSRAYLIRDGRIKQITTDQSLVEVFVSRGLLTATDAEKSSNRGILLQAIGTKEDIQVAVTSLTLQNDDSLLLCSDGLSNKLKSKELLEITARRETVQAACQDMIVAARKRGGEDNITSLLARFSSEHLISKSAGRKITTTLETLSTFDPDRPKIKKRTQGLSSPLRSKTLLYPSTIGIGGVKHSLDNYPQRKELVAEFERLAYHLEKAAESLHSEVDGLKRAAQWLQESGSLDRSLTEMVARLREAQEALKQTRNKVAEAKEKLKEK